MPCLSEGTGREKTSCVELCPRLTELGQVELALPGPADRRAAMYAAHAGYGTPSIESILSWGTEDDASPWLTESRAAYTFAAPVTPPMLMAGDAYGQQPFYPGPLLVPLPPHPANLLAQPTAHANPPVPAPMPAAAAPAPATATTASTAIAPPPAPCSVRRPQSAAAVQKRSQSASSRHTASRSPPPSERPIFHTFGRANVKPTAGGFCYGDYMATHNAKAGAALSLSRRAPAAEDLETAQTHYMEADLRRSVGMQPTTADGDDEGALAATAQLQGGAAPEPTPGAATPEATAAQDGISTAAPASDVYANLPQYDPSTYGAPPLLMPYPGIPFASAPAPAWGGAPWALPPPPMPAQPPQWAPQPMMPPMPSQPMMPPIPFQPMMPPMPSQPMAPASFVPDNLGARLDPRRYKYAPLAAVRSIPPAGQRTLRRDNYS